MSVAANTFKVALATSIVKILFLLQETAVSSQELAARGGTQITSRFKRDAAAKDPADPTMWYLNSHCEVKCQGTVTPRAKCNAPPTLRWFCEYLENEHWCCRQFQYNALSISFRKDCTPVCGPNNLPCTSSRCAVCAMTNFKHKKCCGGCPRPKPIPPPSEDGATALSKAGDPVEMCPELPDKACKIFNEQPEECRTSKDCAYSCASGTCQKKEEVEGECFDACFNHCNSRCGCITTMGCTYDSATGTCKPLSERYCRLTSFPGNECSRKGGFYSVRGKSCQSIFDKGNCELEKTVVAINLGSETAAKDSQDIEYQPQSSITKVDAMSIGKDIAFAPADIKTGRAEDAELLSTALTTIDTVCENQTRECVDFVLPTMNLDGDYELAIRTVEGIHDVMGVRHFSIIFANVEIFTEVDIIGLAGDKFVPLNLLVNFKVADKGKTLILNGHKPRPMGSSTILSFCRGECGVEPGFLVSAFHIIQQKPYIKEQIDPCTVTAVEACDEGKFGVTECRRQDSIYSIDGKYCKMGATGGECTVAEVIKAINFNGLPLEDNRGITYGAGNKKNVMEAVPGMVMSKAPLEPISGASPTEQSLYGNIIFGDETIDHPRPCVSLTLPICEDGKYELAIRVADDEADAPDYRRFNILLQDHPVFEEIDIFSIAGSEKSKAVDLLVNFEVINGVTRIKLKNKPFDTELVIPDEKEATLTFCYSTCTDTTSDPPKPSVTKRSFVLGGISFVKFVEEQAVNPTCDALSNDPCGCRYDGNCEYDVNTEKCIGKPKACPVSCAARERMECRRGKPDGHYYYAVGGVVCHSPVETGNCADPNTLQAINYGGEAHVDIHGVVFAKDVGKPFDDPDNTKVESSLPSPNLMAGVPPTDITLYNMYIWGDGTKGKSCLTYNLPTAGDGFYELSIKTGEPIKDGLRQRDFSYKLNGQYIVQEFEPARYRLPPHAFDLNVNFKVLDVSTKIQMEGHPPSDITSADMTIPLSFCFGVCTWDGVDTNWVIGAFSLLKFKPVLPCNKYNNNPCACRFDEECDVQSNGQCVDHSVVCSIITTPGDECRRGGEHVFYLDNGIICPSKTDSGKCEIEKTLIGVNLNGKLHQDIRGIVFSKGSDIPYDDPKATSTPGVATFQGVPPADVDLYQTYIYGDEKVANDTCITFALPTAGDGRYELSLKNGDVSGSRRRGFNILLNGENLAEHFELARVRKAPDAFDLNVPFKVSGGNTLELSGHSPSTIGSADLSIPLQFCFGACLWPHADVYWSTSGFSLVKFNDGKLCSEYKDDPCGCRQAGNCVFNAVSGDCLSRPDACSNPSPKDPDECRRAGDHIFYADRGVVCISTVDSGNCAIDMTLLAVNLNGMPLVDSLGIAFEDDSKLQFDDPGGTQDVGVTTGDYAQSGVPVEDKNLHGTFWYGDHSVDTQCTTFHLPFSGDGYYELSIKTGETYHDTVGLRSFSILLNGQYVVKELDPNQVRLAPNGFDLNVYYKILRSETKFEMTGHPEIDITTTDGTIPLEVCFGACENTDANWILGAFSVLKLKGSIPCSYYNGDVCACRLNNICEYNSNTDECVNREDVCNYRYTGTSCRRAGDHIFQVRGGIICHNHNPTPYGNCNWYLNLQGINFGDGASTVTDEDGITYVTEGGTGIEDPGQSRQSAESPIPILGIPPEAQDIFKYYIFGDSNVGDTDKCLTCFILVSANGEYELSIKLAEVEYALLQKRAFSVLFNKKYILREFEPNRYRFTPNGMNFNVNFKKFGSLLEIEGYSASAVPPSGKVELEFCFGKCSWPGIDINWFVNAISVVVFKATCDDPKLDADPCECLKSGESKCDYNLSGGKCVYRSVECYNFPTLPNECRRGGSHTFYVHDGLVCNIPDPDGNCKISKVMLAINFGDGAEAITDIHGITFQKDEGIPFDDPDDNKVAAKTDEPVQGIPASDENLYSTYIYGSKQDSVNCVAYHIPTDGDGEYELNIRTAEFSKKTKPQHDVVFKLNGLYIVRLFEPTKYQPSLTGFDLIVNFRVSGGGSKMMMRGHPDVDISSPDKTIRFEFCYGDCKKYKNKIWFISAFSVVKFES